MTESNDLEFRLSGLRSPDGEIALGDLAAIGAAMQQLALRIGRLAAEQEGPGRSLAAVENATKLRLTAVGRGSTRLSIGYGQTDVLPVDDGLEQRTADLFWEVVSGIGFGRRPDWTSPLVDEAALELLEGLGRAGAVEVTRQDGRMTRFAPAEVDRTAWSRSAEGRASDVRVVMTGRLEALDLESGRFRLRDDVGNRIPLLHVKNPHDAAAFVDRKVTATGLEIRGPGGDFRGVDSPVVEPLVLPAQWSGAPAEWREAFTGAGPDPDGGDLTDDEFAAFVAALKG
jgi:hypothetical protein